MNIRGRLGISARQQRRLVRVMELSLVAMLAIGVRYGQTGIIVNCAIGLLVARVPGLLERDYDLPMDAGLTLWITSAVFLHAVGTIVVPGVVEQNLYRTTWWWDHVTHALSASVVAGAGYSVARAIDVHDDEVWLPSEFMFVFILLLTFAFGVLWEVIEFTLGVAAERFGAAAVLTQYGLVDTIADLASDAVGATIVAIWGTTRLSGVVAAIADRLDSESSS